MSTAPDNALELYKLEYEKAAQRYDDIYKSIWTNFSYMAAIAGGILTFGKDKFGIGILAVVAYLPLFFWWWATFEPLNRYADDVAERLADLENILNQKYRFDLFKDLTGGNQQRGGLGHYMSYRGQRNALITAWNALTGNKLVKALKGLRKAVIHPLKAGRMLLRVRYVVRGFLGLALILILILFFSTLGQAARPEVKQINLDVRGDAVNIEIDGKNLEDLKKLVELKNTQTTIRKADGSSRDMKVTITLNDENAKP